MTPTASSTTSEQLRKYYRNRGYFDFRVVASVAELATDKNGFVVTYTIEEGPKYKFGKITVETELKKLDGDLLACSCCRSAPVELYRGREDRAGHRRPDLRGRRGRLRLRGRASALRAQPRDPHRRRGVLGP